MLLLSSTFTSPLHPLQKWNEEKERNKFQLKYKKMTPPKKPFESTTTESSQLSTNVLMSLYLSFRTEGCGYSSSLCWIWSLLDGFSLPLPHWKQSVDLGWTLISVSVGLTNLEMLFWNGVQWKIGWLRFHRYCTNVTKQS